MKWLGFIAAPLFLSSCSEQVLFPPNETWSQADYEYLAIANPNKMSLASRRALEMGYHKNAEWFGKFRTHKLTGDFTYQKNVTRRDPSKVLLIDHVYYTWYTKTTGAAQGFGTGDSQKKVLFILQR